MDRQERAAALDVRYLLHGQLVSRALCAVAALGIPDLLTAGPLSPAELARRTGADPSRLRQLIAALVPFEVFTIRPDGEVELARLGRALTTDAAGSALAGAQLAHDLMSQAWQGLPETVRTGVPAFDRAFGGDLFTHLDRDPGLRTVFDRSQANDLELEVDAILRSGDFGTTGTVVDVGGGDGTLLVHLLAAHPGLRGVLVDRPIAVAAARGRLAAAGLAERAEATPVTSSRPCPLAAMSTSCARSCTTGTTTSASPSCAPAGRPCPRPPGSWWWNWPPTKPPAPDRRPG